MKYDNSNEHPRETVIKSIEISESIVEQKVQSIQRFAALLSKHPAQFYSAMVYEYAYHCVVHTLKDSARIMPSWHYMEHAAEWTRQALSRSLPDVEYTEDPRTDE